jgi:hypothetical protein
MAASSKAAETGRKARRAITGRSYSIFRSPGRVRTPIEELCALSRSSTLIEHSRWTEPGPCDQTPALTATAAILLVGTIETLDGWAHAST